MSSSPGKSKATHSTGRTDHRRIEAGSPASLKRALNGLAAAGCSFPSKLTSGWEGRGFDLQVCREGKNFLPALVKIEASCSKNYQILSVTQDLTLSDSLHFAVQLLAAFQVCHLHSAFPNNPYRFTPGTVRFLPSTARRYQ